MIKYCNECKHSATKMDSSRYSDVKCFNPVVNKNDYFMVSSVVGKGYGSDARDQRKEYSWPWQSKCGIQGKFWERSELQLVEQPL